MGGNGSINGNGNGASGSSFWQRGAQSAVGQGGEPGASGPGLRAVVETRAGHVSGTASSPAAISNGNGNGNDNGGLDNGGSPVSVPGTFSASSLASSDGANTMLQYMVPPVSLGRGMAGGAE